MGRAGTLLKLGAATAALVAGVRVGQRLGLWGKLYAAGYDAMQAKPEREFLGEIREGLLAGASGRVLEIGAGTGANLSHYPQGDGLEVVVTEPDTAMLARARRKAAEIGVPVEFVESGAYPLTFPDESFDTVVFTLCLCTIPDPSEALREARRVLKPGGKILFLEHVRSSDPHLAAWQDRLAPVWRVVAGGCHCNLDTKSLIEAGGFKIDWIAEREDERVPIPIVRPGIMGAALKN